MKKTLLLLGIMVLGVWGLSFAKDSFSLSVSCSIPSVPGLNAPLVQGKTQIMNMNQAQNTEIKYETGGQETAMIQEEEARITLAENDADKITTVYSR